MDQTLKNNLSSKGTSSMAKTSTGSSDVSGNGNVEQRSDRDSQSNTETDDSGQHDPGKMFIGGLSWQTTAEGLRDYFSKFGEVNECMVMRDPATKRARYAPTPQSFQESHSRGFGFITFVDPASVDKVLAIEHHELDGKKIDPKVAFPKKSQTKMVVKTKKVFIGGLSSTSTLEDMKSYFQQYGKIEDAMLMYDKATQRHRGFGFITFDDDEVSDKVCEIHFHEINGKMVECKKAQPKEVMLPLQLNKSRAAAARNLYGLAPEQLLAYASYIPRLPGPYSPGMLYPAGNLVFNGFQQSFGMSPSGRSSVSNNGVPSTSSTAGMVNPRDLAVAHAAAQQQAVYEAALAYASMGDIPGITFQQPPHQQPIPNAYNKM